MTVAQAVFLGQDPAKRDLEFLELTDLCTGSISLTKAGEIAYFVPRRVN
jgi:hypothetical protein